VNSKERMQVAMEHKEPDRVPLQVSFVPEVEKILREKYKDKFGELSSDIEKKYAGVTELDIALGHDVLLLTYGMSSGYYKDTQADSYVDDWGITWRKVAYDTPNGTGHYTEIVDFPLADDAKIDSYVPPNPDNEDMGYAEDIIAQYGEEKYICGVIDCSIFEALKYLRGMAQSLIDIIANKDIAHKIMDMTVEYHLVLGKKLMDLGVDMLFLADDVGSEHSMTMSPETFREMQKPKMAYMINELKGRNKNIKIAYHSDGYIEPVIDDLIEVGVDLLNPIQPESMDPSHIKKRYGNGIGMWGTISVQSTLPFGKPKDVENKVKERIETCGPSGGFLLAPTHNIQLDVPPENIDAFYYAVEKYGAYSK